MDEVAQASKRQQYSNPDTPLIYYWQHHSKYQHDFRVTGNTLHVLILLNSTLINHNTFTNYPPYYVNIALTKNIPTGANLNEIQTNFEFYVSQNHTSGDSATFPWWIRRFLHTSPRTNLGRSHSIHLVAPVITTFPPCWWREAKTIAYKCK